MGSYLGTEAQAPPGTPLLEELPVIYEASTMKEGAAVVRGPDWHIEASRVSAQEGAWSGPMAWLTGPASAASEAAVSDVYPGNIGVVQTVDGERGVVWVRWRGAGETNVIPYSYGRQERYMVQLCEVEDSAREMRPKALLATPNQLQEKRRDERWFVASRTPVSLQHRPLVEGCHVMRGPDWDGYGDMDGGGGCVGVVERVVRRKADELRGGAGAEDAPPASASASAAAAVERAGPCRVRVQWLQGPAYEYDYGAGGRYCVSMVDVDELGIVRRRYSTPAGVWDGAAADARFAVPLVCVGEACPCKREAPAPTPVAGAGSSARAGVAEPPHGTSGAPKV